MRFLHLYLSLFIVLLYLSYFPLLFLLFLYLYLELFVWSGERQGEMS